MALATTASTSSVSAPAYDIPQAVVPYVKTALAALLTALIATRTTATDWMTEELNTVLHPIMATLPSDLLAFLARTR